MEGWAFLTRWNSTSFLMFGFFLMTSSTNFITLGSTSAMPVPFHQKATTFIDIVAG
jgi:hypothetical protein